MTGKQTVQNILNHITPGYIPIGTYAIDCDTVREIIGHETYVRDKPAQALALWAGRRDKSGNAPMMKRLYAKILTLS